MPTLFRRRSASRPTVREPLSLVRVLAKEDVDTALRTAADFERRSAASALLRAESYERRLRTAG